jgi:hypothetical protein
MPQAATSATLRACLARCSAAWMVAPKCQLEAAYSGLLDQLLALPGMIAFPILTAASPFFFFATLVAKLFPTVLRWPDDLVLFAGFFGFLVLIFLVPLQLWLSCLLPS